MNHDFESKEWADNHQILSDGIDRLFSHIAKGFALLNNRGSKRAEINVGRSVSQHRAIGAKSGVEPPAKNKT